MAHDFAMDYKRSKAEAKGLGSEVRAFPGVHHPIFKGKPVNHDAREQFIGRFRKERGGYTVFHAVYGELVQALYDVGASRHVFCVNVDAVIAALLLALLWKDYQAGELKSAA